MGAVRLVFLSGQNPQLSVSKLSNIVLSICFCWTLSITVQVHVHVHCTVYMYVNKVITLVLVLELLSHYCGVQLTCIANTVKTTVELL